MASEETERVRGTVGTQTGEPDAGDPSARFSLDDFRLRLDSPLFHRDPGVATAEPAAQLRELTWEKVVRPAPSNTPQTMAVDHEATPAVEDFRAQLIPAAALPPMPLLSGQPTAQSVMATLDDVLNAAGVSLPPGLLAPVQPAAAPVVDEVSLQLVRTPPRQQLREPDPVMSGLADMIARGGAQPAPMAPAPMAPAPMAPAPAEPPAFSPWITPPSTPAVEAELNRLAFLPDREEPLGPVEVPAILTADVPVMAAAPFVPSLSQHDMYAPRTSPVVTPRRNYMELAATMSPPSRRAKRHPVRRVFATIVLLGLLGGGLFAAKYYFLDQRWSGEIKPLAAEVETARGLSFDRAVEVASLPAADYSVKLIAVALGVDSVNADSTAGEWRALGLLSGPLDIPTLGLSGIADSPAFYDPGSEKIYVVEGLPTELRRFAIQRALTLALLDQTYGWSGRTAHSSPAVAHGTRALYDADALATATSLLDESERVSVLTQQQALYSAYQIPASPVPFATATATRSGLALRPYFDGAPAATRDAVERNALVTDGQVLDLRRLLAGSPETVGAQSQGMLFWYHVLAARIDNDAAWRAAMSWRGDSVSVVRGTSGVCVTALVQVDPAAFDSAVAAFKAWAGAAPHEAATDVSAVPGTTTGQLTVTACDPGANVATNDGRMRLALGAAPLRAEQFRQLTLAFPQLPQVQLACAVYGADAVSPADERSVVDPVEGWGVLSSHPAPDPNNPACATP